MRIAILRKCITTIDIILVMRNQRDQHVEEQKDTETKMHQNEHCMLSCKHLVIEFYFQDVHLHIHALTISLGAFSKNIQMKIF